MADMLPVSTPAETRIVSGKKRGFFRRKVEWLFSPELFHLKLLIGAAVGVLVTIVLAVTCVVFTFRHQQLDDATRAHDRGDQARQRGRERHRGARKCASQPFADEKWRLRAKLGSASGSFPPSQQGAGRCPRNDAQQRKRILQMREIVRNWFMTSSLSAFELFQLRSEQAQVEWNVPRADFGGSQVPFAGIQPRRTDQIDPRHARQGMGNSVHPNLDLHSQAGARRLRHAEGVRGYLLTGDRVFIDGYKKASANF